MTRFDLDYDDGLIPWDLWHSIVSNALGGKRGQAALAELESALTALPEQKLVAGKLAAEGSVCAVGAYVAKHRAEAEGITVAEAVERMVENTPCECNHSKDSHDERGCGGRSLFDRNSTCYCKEYRPERQYAHDTAEAGQRFGLTWTVAWHLAYLNDEQFENCTPEERYEKVLAWVQRALGKEPAHA